jgi:uncharacterized protein with HEPN domain
MNEHDLVRLRHMLDAAQKAISFAEGKTRESLDTDEQLTFALLKAVEIIGEAAGQVSKETQAASPEVPWASIIGMRNRLVHAYFDVNLNVVWDTVAHNLPPLVDALEQIIPPPQD